MKFMVTGVGCGKTVKAMADAIVFARKYPTVFVTFGEKEAERLTKLYQKELLGSKLEIMSFRRLLNNPKKRYKRVIVDNVDMMIADLLYPHIDMEYADDPIDRGRIDLVTATGMPIRDLYLVRETAAELWKVAAQDARCAPPKNLRDYLISNFEHRAKDLMDKIPEWYKVVRSLEGGAKPSEPPKLEPVS